MQFPIISMIPQEIIIGDDECQLTEIMENDGSGIIADTDTDTFTVTVIPAVHVCVGSTEDNAVAAAAVRSIIISSVLLLKVALTLLFQKSHLKTQSKVTPVARLLPRLYVIKLFHFISLSSTMHTTEFTLKEKEFHHAI